MRILRISYFLIMTAFASVSCAGNGGEIFTEDFNDSARTMGIWTDNSAEAQGASVEFLAEGGIDGSGCVRIMNPERGSVGISHTLSGLEPDRLYRMTAKIKCKGVGDGRGAVLFLAPDGLEQPWNASEFAYGDTDWLDCYMDFVPDRDGNATICCALGFPWGTYNGGTASGEVMIDDVAVAEVNEAQMYFRSGEHISLAIDRDKMCVPDSVADRWLADMDKVYEAYEDLVGDAPYESRRILVMTTPGIEPGYWALAGNPILWNNHVGIDKLLMRTMENDDWNFGILHEIGHTFSPGTVCDNGRWNWNDEIFANFRMSYALEVCNGAVSQRDVLYRGAEIKDYYKIFYDETIGQGIAKNNGDALHYTFLRIKDKYGWDVYKNAFRSLYALDPKEMEHLNDDYQKMLFFLSHVSQAAGEDVTTTCYTKEELRLIEESLKK